MDNFEITVEESDIDRRIDVFLANKLESFSRSYIQDLIKKGKATINGKAVKANYRLREGESIVLDIPKPEPLEILPENIPLDILYEDDDVIAFKDIAPVAPVHMLVVPKKEIPTINDITDEDALLIGKIYKVIGKLAKKFGIDKDGYRVVSNCNENAGQTVFHIHFHLIGGEKLGTMV